MAPYIRIILRYLAGFLVAKGITDAATAELIATDPSLLDGLLSAASAIWGALVASVAELWYRMAKKFGWDK